MKVCLTVLIVLFWIGSSNAQKSWHVVASGGLVEMRTENTFVKTKGRFINGWKVDAGVRIYRHRFYLNPGIDFRYINLVSSPKIEILKDQPASYSVGVPLFIGYDIFRNEQFKFRALTGFHGNYLFKIDKNKLGIREELYNPFSLSYAFGLGVDFYPVTFDFRYERGLLNYYQNPDYKANFFCFSLGFLLDK